MKPAAAVAAHGPKLIDFALEFAQTSNAFIKIKDTLNVGCILGVGFQRLNFGVGGTVRVNLLEAGRANL